MTASITLVQMAVHVWTALALMNVYVKMVGLVKIAKNKWKCVQLQHAKMMQAVLIFSKTISAYVPKEQMENNAR